MGPTHHQPELHETLFLNKQQPQMFVEAGGLANGHWLTAAVLCFWAGAGPGHSLFLSRLLHSKSAWSWLSLLSA